MSVSLLFSIKKSIKAAILSKALGIISQITIFFAFTQTLTIEQYGYLMLIISSAGWLTIGTGGIYSLVARNVSMDSSVGNISYLIEKNIKIIVVVSLIPLALVGFAVISLPNDKLMELFLVKKILEGGDGNPFYLVLYLIVVNILISIFSIGESINLGMQRNHVNYIYNIYQNMIMLFFVIVVFFNAPLLVYLVVLTLPVLLAKMMNFYYLFKSSFFVSGIFSKKCSSAGFPLVYKTREIILFIFMGFCAYVSQGGLISIASFSFSDTELGLFSVFVRLSSIVGMVLLVYTQPMGATLGAHWEKRDLKKVRYLIRIGYLIVFVISLFVVFLFLFATYLIDVGFTSLPNSLIVLVDDGYLFIFWLVFFIFQMANNVNCVSFIYMKKTALPVAISFAELLLVLAIFLIVRPDQVSKYYCYSSIFLYALVLLPSIYFLRKFTRCTDLSPDLRRS